MTPTARSTVVFRPATEPLRKFLHPRLLVADLWRNRPLIHQFALRDLLGRYKGSQLGVVWSLLHPLLLLAVYTFVFSVVFKARWGVEQSSGSTGFALALFAGLIVFNQFGECANRAPSLILGSPNYVKKVVFPLQVLPVSVVASTAVLTAVNTLILVVVNAILNRSVSTTIFCFPLVLLPVVLFGLGASWFLASLGVFLRDVGQVVTVLVQVLMFATPIFYPLSMLGETARKVVSMNPMTPIVESARRTLLWSQWPEWGPLLGMTLLALFVALTGYAWFMKTKRGFADVV